MPTIREAARLPDPEKKRTDMRIRQARQTDAHLLPAVERSAGLAFLVLPDLSWIARDEVLSTDRHRELIADGHCWVAVDGHDAPVGFLSAGRLGNWLHIWELAVTLACQRRGIGRALLDGAIEAAKAQGLEAITLTTFRHVAWNQPFYEKLGFRVLDPPPRELQRILDEEAAHGLARDERCAMTWRP